MNCADSMTARNAHFSEAIENQLTKTRDLFILNQSLYKLSGLQHCTDRRRFLFFPMGLATEMLRFIKVQTKSSDNLEV